LQNAREIIVDIDRRLQQLGDSAAPFLPLVAELRKAMAAVGGGQ
jgi:hypothetical protein